MKALKWNADNIRKDPSEAQEYDDQINALKDKAYRKATNNEYWWTGFNSFKKLADYCSSSENDEPFEQMMRSLYLMYKRACMTLHANSIGNVMRLGMEKGFVGVDNRAKMHGHELPLYYATHCLIPVIGITCKELNIDGDDLLKESNDLAIFYYSMPEHDSARYAVLSVAKGC